jgi:hypothetical protein
MLIDGSKSKEYISESDEEDGGDDKPAAVATAGQTQTDTAGTSALSDAGISGAEGSANGDVNGGGGGDESGMEVDT